MALRNVVIAELNVMPVGTTASFTMGNVTRVKHNMFIVHRGGNIVMQGDSKSLVKLNSLLLDKFNIPALGATR